MCIMEVRPGQHSSTIAQACAHNVSTVERDMDMFEALVTARGERATLAQLKRAHSALRDAYRDLLSVFSDEITRVVQSGEHIADIGSEREHIHPTDADMVRQVERAVIANVHAAERYETR